MLLAEAGGMGKAIRSCLFSNLNPVNGALYGDLSPVAESSFYS
jgi:hypothetical protein